MIYFDRVSKYHLDAELGHAVMLEQATAAFPTDFPVAILGPDAKACSAVLGLLTGSLAPEKGRVERGRVRCSPVINSRGFPGASLMPQLTGLDNIRMFANLYGVDPGRLAGLVEAAGEFGMFMDIPVRRFDVPRRRALEVTIIAALPFECYFVDALHLIEPSVIARLFKAAEARGAGVLFSTTRFQQALRLASVGALVSNGALTWTHNLQETLATHG